MIYEYKCDNCGHNFEIKMSISEFKELKKCPECKKNKLKQVFHVPHTYVYNEPTTVGLQGKRNWENTGTYEKDKIKREQKEFDHYRKFKPLVDRGLISPDKVPDPHKESPFGEMDKQTKKKIFTGNKKEIKKKVKKYIEEG